MNEGTWGADPAALEALAGDLRRAGQQLRHIQRSLGARIHQAPWKGGDAVRFEADWRGPHTTRLLSVAGMFEEVATIVQRNAAEQRGASKAEGLSAFDKVRAGIDYALATPDRAFNELRDVVKNSELPNALKTAKMISKFGRAIPVAGVAFSVASLDFDLISHALSGDLGSDEAIGELALDVLSLGISIAEVGTTATVVGIPLDVFLTAASIAVTTLSLNEDFTRALGHAIKESVGRAMLPTPLTAPFAAPRAVEAAMQFLD